MPSWDTPSSMAFCSGARGNSAVCHSGEIAPKTDGPKSTPASNCPMTPGWPIRCINSPRSRPATRRTTIWRKNVTSDGPARCASPAAQASPTPIRARVSARARTFRCLTVSLPPMLGRTATPDTAEGSRKEKRSGGPARDVTTAPSASGGCANRGRTQREPPPQLTRDSRPPGARARAFGQEARCGCWKPPAKTGGKRFELKCAAPVSGYLSCFFSQSSIWRSPSSGRR